MNRQAGGVSASAVALGLQGDEAHRWSGIRRAPRIACVQNGDFKTARETIRRGGAESYFGMRDSVDALSRLFATRTGLIVSLEAAPHRETEGGLTLVSVARPLAWMRLGRLREELRARLVIDELEAFRPTHVLLRTGGQLGLKVARWCARRSIPTLVLLANAVYGENAFNTRINRAFMQVLNDPCFVRVGNYKPTACASMVDQGLTPAKIVSFAFDGERQPSAHPPKQLSLRGPFDIVFAGRMVAEKGPLELLEAVRILHQRGVPVRATLYGEGALLDAVRTRAKELPAGLVRTPGVVGNDVLFQSLREATFACVPSRSTFVEGMPMALTEALAARTPVLASNCPVFAKSFQDGEGVRIFREQDPEHLAAVIVDALSDREGYAQMSASTEAAFRRVAAQHGFGELLDQWGRELDHARA